MKERSLEESNLDGLLLAGMITMRCLCTREASTLEIDETKTKWMNSALYPAAIESIAENSPNPYDNGLTGLECSKRSSQSVEQKNRSLVGLCCVTKRVRPLPLGETRLFMMVLCFVRFFGG